MQIKAGIILTLMIIAYILAIPIPVKAQLVGDTGIYLKAGFPEDALNWTGKPQSPSGVFLPVIITDDGTLRIYINRTIITWTQIRISFIFPENVTAPSTGGVFLPIGYNNTLSPTNPDYFNSAVIDITKPTNWSDTVSGSLYVNVTNTTDIVLIAIRINKTLLDLSNATFIQNVYLGATSPSFQVNLYNKKLYVKIFNAAEWDARVSSNTVTFIEVLCSDVMINVYGSPAIHGSNVSIVVSLERFFNKVYDVTGGLLLDIDYNITLLNMINYYNYSERYELVNITNANRTEGGYPIPFTNATVERINYSTIKYIGINLTEYSPSVHDYEKPYLAAFYFFHVYYTYGNETVDITLNVTSGDRNAPCVYTETTPFLEVKSTLYITLDDRVGTPNANPGDIINFTAYNVPSNHLNTTYKVETFNLSTYYALTTFIGDIEYYSNGTIIGAVELPELPYAGLSYRVFLVFNSTKYIMDGILTIEPYIEIYVLTNASAYYEDTNGYYIGRFVPDNRSAPGDYIVIEGHGFDLTNLSIFKVNFLGINITILNISTIHTNSTTGMILLLAKLLDENNGAPVPIGAGNLVVGYLGTNNTASRSFETITGVPFKKVLFNPKWFLNDTGYYINHTKLGDPYQYFIVEYPFINDTFTTTYWPLPTTIEVIGWDDTTFILKFYNKIFNVTFNWLTMSLANGYGYENLYGREIPFLPYGNYTLLDETLTSVNNRTVFTVLMGIDIDVSSCRSGTFNITVVGAAPNTEYNFTFDYHIYDLTYPHLTRHTPPQWTGEFIISLITNEYGTGFVSVNLTDLYNSSLVLNVTWDTIVYGGFHGIGELNLLFKWNGTLLGFTDNLSIPINYVFNYVEDYYETYFHVNVTYNVTIETVTIDIIDRPRFTITVPEIVLPGDDVTVQIFPHKVDVWDLIVYPQYLYEEPEIMGWHIYVGLVDPITNTVFQEIEGYSYEIPDALIVQNIDNDPDPEVWFVVNIHIPFNETIGVDKTYRVDVRLFLAVLTPDTTITNYTINDQGCYVNISINGTIYWKGYDSYILIGGDHQLVTVLGILEAKIDGIADDIVVLNATVNDINRYIRVNVTEFLNAINGTVMIIQDNITSIIRDLAVIKANLSTILQLLTNVDSNVTTILSYCENITGILRELNMTLDETKTYVLEIRGNLTELINTVNNEVLPRFIDLYNNISIKIVNATNYVVENIVALNETLNNRFISLNNTIYAVNNSISLLIISSRDELNNTIASALNTVLDAINQSTSYIVANIWASTYYIEGTIYDVSDDIVSNITVKIDNVYDSLEDLIVLRTDEIKMLIEDNVTTIITQINNSRIEIKNYLNNLEIAINGSFAEIKAGLLTIKTNISTIISQIANMTNNLENARIEIIDAINNTKNDIVTVLMNVNNTLTIAMSGLREQVINALDDMRNFMNTRFNNMTNTLTIALNNMKTYLENTSTTLINTVSSRLDETRTLLSDKLDTAVDTLKTKIDALDRKQTDSFNSLNSSITLFSSVILLLEVIILALTGYGIVKRPRG